MEKQLKKAGFTVAAMILATLFSKALGLLRQMLVAGIFAASTEGIAFSAASKIPFAIFDMLFSAAVLGSFLPIYRGHLTKEPARAKSFSASFFSCVAAATALIAVFGVIFAKPILFLTAPSLDAETARLAANLLRIMFPAMIFAGAAYTLVGILQSHERFLLPALVSALSNLVIIGYLALCGRLDGVRAAYGLAVTYLISWVVQFLTLAVPLMRSRRFPRLTTDFRNADLRLSLRRSLPVMFGSWLLPMGTLTANFFSSFIATGAAIVVFENAFAVFSILTGLLTYGVCNYLFPKLAEQAASDDRTRFGATVRAGLFASFAMILPVALASAILADEGIRLLYLRGNFTEELASAAAVSLRMLTLAMPFCCMTELLSRAFYAGGKVKYPMWAALAGIAVNILFCVLFLANGALSVATVAVSNAAGQITAALVLAALAIQTWPELRHDTKPRKALLLALCAALSGGAMLAASTVFRRFLEKKDIKFPAFENFITIGIVFCIGIVVYLLCIMGTRIFSSNKKHTRKEDTP